MNNNIIDKITYKTKYPSWWVESVAIQYSNIEEFIYNNKETLISLDFSKLEEDELEENVLYKKVIISNYKIFNNITSDNFNSRYIKKESILSDDEIVSEYNSLICNGKVSNFFAVEKRNTSMLRPRDILGSYFQVKHEGDFYQWKVIDCINYCEETANFDFTLEINKLEERYEVLLSRLNEEEKIEALKDEVEHFIEWNKVILRSLSKALYNAHLNNLRQMDESKIINSNTPAIFSSFEKINYSKDLFLVDFDLSSVFYNSCVLEVNNFKELEKRELSEDIIDSIYKHKVSAIIMALTCLETYINILGGNLFKDIWSEISGVNLNKKIILVIKQCNKEFNYMEDKTIKSIIDLIDLKDVLIKNNIVNTEIISNNDSSYTKLYDILSSDLINDLDLKVKEFILLISNIGGYLSPKWINS
ncbi:hypothetical protein [Clostridium sp.]|uniref:hypothetical protein n=1 Tax=Clostridium sp. TaxID=1506 RepID=UPI003F314849